MSDTVKKIIIFVVCVLVLGFGAYMVKGFFSSSGELQSGLLIADPETGDKAYIKVDRETPAPPYKNKKTGKMSMYPAEMCYWNECGERGGTPVVLNEYLDKKGPTKCPVCGHRVVLHNPRPPSK